MPSSIREGDDHLLAGGMPHGGAKLPGTPAGSFPGPPAPARVPSARPSGRPGAALSAPPARDRSRS